MTTARTTFLRALRVALCLVAVERFALAADAPGKQPGDPALARDLSKQGYELLLANKCDEAVPLLTRSQDLSPDPRTLVNLARCEDKLGRLGSAVEHLNAARDLARDRHLPEMSSQIEALMAQVEGRLARVVVKIKDDAPRGTVVKRGAVELPKSALDAGVPLDPGEQTFEVSAPGRAAQTFRVTVAEGERKTITVAPGAPLPPSSAHPSPPSAASGSTPHGSGAGKTLGVVGMSVGGAAIATGLVFGLIAINGKRSAESAGCVDTRCPDASSASTRDDAKAAGVVSTVFVGAGAFVAAVGLVTFLVSPSSNAGTSASALPATWRF